MALTQLLLVFHLLIIKAHAGGFLPGTSTIATTPTSRCQKWQHHHHHRLPLFVKKSSMVSVDESRREISKYYRRDRNDDNDRPISDPETLAKLLERRYQARRNHQNKYSKKQQTNRLKQLDTQLWTLFRVKVYDRPPIWTRNPHTIARRNLQLRKWTLQDDYGVNGHPYQPAESEIDTRFCDLTRSEIHSLLGQLALYSNHHPPRTDNGYNADAIRFELEIHGVHVCDTTWQWSTRPSWNRTSTSAVTHGRPEDMHPDSSSVRSIPPSLSQCPFSSPKFNILPTNNNTWDLRTSQRIQQLVQMRQAVEEEDHFLAACMDRELNCTYHVQIISNPTDAAGLVVLPLPTTTNNNNTNTPVSVEPQLSAPPSSSSIRRPPDEQTNYYHRFPNSIFVDSVDLDHTIPQYQPSPYSVPTTNLTIREQERVLDLIRQRIVLREHGRFLEADAIRKELWHTYRVGIHDRLQQYSYGGTF
jgi:hypothetical protein